MQAAVNSLVADVNKEVEALRASEATQEEELKAYMAEVEAYKTRVALEAQLKVCMAAMANIGASRLSQMSTTPKRNALQTPIYNGVRNATEIDSFLWGLKAYFGA